MGTVWQAQWDGYPHVLPWLLNSKVEWSEPWACLGQVGWEGSVPGCSGHHAEALTGGTSVPTPLAGLGKARGMYAVEGGWKKARQRAEKPALLSELSQVAHNNAVMAQECMFCPWLSATWHHSGLSPWAAFPSMPCRTLKGGFHVVVILTGFLPHQLPLLPLQPSKTHDTLLSYSKEFHSSTLYNRTAPKKPTIPLVLKQACWRLFFCLFCGGFILFVCLFLPRCVIHSYWQEGSQSCWQGSCWGQRPWGILLLGQPRVPARVTSPPPHFIECCARSTDGHLAWFATEL